MNKRRLYTLLMALAISCMIIAGCSSREDNASIISDKSAEATEQTNEKTAEKTAEKVNEKTSGEAAEKANFGGTKGEDEAVGEEEEVLAPETIEEVQDLQADVADNPVVTDAMREVLDQHGIPEESIASDPSEYAKPGVSKEDAGEEPPPAGEEPNDVPTEHAILGFDVTPYTTYLSNFLFGKPVHAAPNCPTTGNTPVALYRNGGNISDADLRSIAGAIDNQMWNQYSYYYSPCVFVYYAPTAAQIGAGSEIMNVWDGPPPTGAANGGHSYNTSGIYGFFYVTWSTQTWDYVTRSLSHEVMEMSFNPYPDSGLDKHTVPNPATVVGGPANDTVSVQQEVADMLGMEGDYYVANWWSGGDGRSWKMNGFVLPDWWRWNSIGPWDYKQLTTGPFKTYGTNSIILYYYPASQGGNGPYKKCKSFVDQNYYCWPGSTWF